MGRVTSKDIALRAGVSRTTVSFVINGRMDLPVAAETRERVLRVAQEMGYVPNASARGLVTGRTQMIGIVADRPTDPHYSTLIEDLLAAAQKADYHLLFVSSGDNSASVLTAGSRLDGLIVIGNSYFSMQLLDHPEQLRIPYVVIGCPQYVPNCPRPPYSVEWDDEEGGRLAAQHLLRLGHRRLAVLAGRVSEMHPKARGFIDTVRQAGAETTFIDHEDESNQYESGWQMFGKLRERSPETTAIFCRNDVIAIGALGHAAECGIRVPHDLSVVGYSDLPMAAYAVPTLTTIATPIRAAGLKALELLLQTLRGHEPEEKLVDMSVRLIERKSTAPPP